MALRIVLDRPDDLEAVPLKEQRSLKRLRIKRKLFATMASGIRLGRCWQSTTKPAPSHVFTHPQGFDPAGLASRPAVEPSDQLPVVIGLGSEYLVTERSASLNTSLV
jgi:hypothetical protein